MMRAGVMWAGRVCQLLSRGLNALLMGLVRAYRFFLSPWLGSACRFTPTCSQYALQALADHGPAAGSYLAARRLLRCHPGGPGGHDPVPAAKPRLFARFCNPSSDSTRS
jgi:putative membrane protein insertion efficiency factor